MLKSKKIRLNSTISGLEGVLIAGASEKGTWSASSSRRSKESWMREFEGLDVGDRVRGKLMETDGERRFNDFSRAEEDRGLVQGETHVLNCPMKPSLLDSERNGGIH